MAETPTAEEILEKLVAFKTISSRSNLSLIQYVQDFLAGYGVSSELVSDDSGEKAALYALIGPAEPGGVVLSGHTDVVPVQGQPWTTDPFKLTERDGNLYGRGTCDMKGFLAACLAMVPAYARAPLKRPVQLAFTYDEEVGLLGARNLIPKMQAALPAASVFVGEPTMMDVVTGHKSIAEIRTHVRGHEVHSSLNHTGVSAVMIAARLITWVDEQNRANRENISKSDFVPPWTTLHAGIIRGGTAHNITARDCEFTMDVRAIPEENNAAWLQRYQDICDEMQRDMQAIAPDSGITVTVSCDAPGCRPEENGTAEQLARQLTGDNGTHVVSYATEAGLFQDAGYSTIVCGPGSIEQAHQPDEFIARDQLAAAVAFQERLRDHLCT